MYGLVLLALLLACRTPADHEVYTQALHADREHAWDLCSRITDVTLRGDCQADIAGRDLRFEDCGAIEAQVWRDECWFEAAEAQSRSGDMSGALGACQRSGYAHECQDHVLGMLAMTWVAVPVPEVAERYLALRPVLPDRSLDFLFWRSYFRNRIAMGQGTTRVGCPDKDCRAAAETEVEAVVSRSLGVERKACFEPPVFAWDQDDDGHALLSRALSHACAAHPAGRWHPPVDGPPR